MNLHSILHRQHNDGSRLPQLESARLQGGRESWSNERLERLVTEHEADEVLRRGA